MSDTLRSWLKPLLAPLRPAFRELLAASLFTNLLALAIPVFVQQVYDRVVGHAGVNTLVGLVAGVVVVLGFDTVLRQSRARLFQAVSLKIDVTLTRRLFDKINALPLRVLESKPVAHWQALFRDVDVVRNTLSGPTAALAADLPFVVVFVAMIFVLAKPLAVVLLLTACAYVGLAWSSGAALGEAAAGEGRQMAQRDRLLAEIVAGRTTVKALSLDRALKPQWEDAQAATIARAIRRGDLANVFQNIGQTLTPLSTVAMTSVGALYIIDQQVSVGALVAANMLTGRLIGPLTQLVGAWRTLAAFRAALTRLGALFAETEERQTAAVALGRPTGQLTIEDASFRYTAKAAPVLDGLGLKFPANAVTAVLGANGSGKTTLLKLLHGLYAPDTGRVLLDGADIAQFTRHELAAWIGYVPQDCVLFHGSIRDNIALAAPDADDEAILRAARLAGVHQYIVDLPSGYATAVGEGGAAISGGQRQRIAIARALVADPPVVLLDEPSASLDRQAEDELRHTLATLARDHAVVMVSHSPVLLAAAQFAVVLDRGRIAMAGPAADVLPRLFAARAPQPAGVA